VPSAPRVIIWPRSGSSTPGRSAGRIRPRQGRAGHGADWYGRRAGRSDQCRRGAGRRGSDGANL